MTQLFLMLSAALLAACFPSPDISRSESRMGVLGHTCKQIATGRQRISHTADATAKAPGSDGGGAGPYGRPSVGKVTSTFAIVAGSGDKPDRPKVCDPGAAAMNLCDRCL